VRGRSRRLAWALAAAFLPALAACGIPVAGGPQALPASEVPFGLLRPVAPPAPVAPAPVPTAPVSVYLVYGDRLLALTRQVPAPPSLRKAIDALLAGPTPPEARAGVGTALRAATVASVAQSGGRALIGLGSDLAQAYGTTLVLAMGQLVLTATAQPGVSSVLFSFRGHPVQVPTGDGTLASRPLTRADYAGLLLGGPPQAPPASPVGPGPSARQVGPAQLLVAPPGPAGPTPTAPAVPPPPGPAPALAPPPASTPPPNTPPPSAPPATAPPRHHRHDRGSRHDDQD
jgi:hypothetical protein